LVVLWGGVTEPRPAGEACSQSSARSRSHPWLSSLQQSIWVEGNVHGFDCDGRSWTAQTA
ncbi:MAG: hypothetical protein ACE149_10795, partial [Armatimonadota bacterium]